MISDAICINLYIFVLRAYFCMKEPWNDIQEHGYTIVSDYDHGHYIIDIIYVCTAENSGWIIRIPGIFER